MKPVVPQEHEYSKEKILEMMIFHMERTKTFTIETQKSVKEMAQKKDG